jgi:hypothetical protein
MDGGFKVIHTVGHMMYIVWIGYPEVEVIANLNSIVLLMLRHRK